MAASLSSGRYGQQRHFGGYTQPPQPPPSPPMDEPKCSLPSISNLLGIADAGSPTSEHGPGSQGQSPQPDAFNQGSYFKTGSRPSSGYAKSTQPQHRGLPPTPPMSTDASFSNHSPSSKSAGTLPLAPAGPTGYYYENTPPLEADQQHRHQPPSDAAPRAPTQGHYPHQTLPPTSYLDQPPSGTYYQNVPPPPPAQPQMSGIYYQRPLPQAFPPPPMPVPVGMPPSSGSSPWQHHHYLSPTHGAAFPQSQDRYICQTCNKAFSRPSSLRIHSHSHTGEKPFKCPHAGCGKAFSVRSNMKRHERGCHSFEVSPGGPGLA